MGIAELERRIKALEQNRGATMRFGDVVEVDEKKGTARVKFNDADGLVTMPLRVSQRRTLKDQAQELPDVGEHVFCLFTGQGYEQGVIGGAVYSQPDPSPGRPSHVDYRKYEDGTEIEYDRKEHKLTATVKGSADVQADKEVNLRSATVLTLQGDQQINLATPNLSIGGLEGGSCKTKVRADLDHLGDYDQIGRRSQIGDKAQVGNHHLSGDVDAGGKVIDAGGNTNHHGH